MLSPSDFNNAVPQFTNGNYASNPLNPQYIAEPSSTDYNRGVEPIQTLPAQWWNWFMNKFTTRFNKVNVYVKNIFNELSQLLSLVSETPSGTEGEPTIGQLKDMFETKYPDYLKTVPALSNTYVPQTTKVNGQALSGNVTISCVACAGADGSGTAFGSAATLNKKAGASGVTYVEYSGADGCCLLAGDFLAYWDGAYSSAGSSNLRYYCGGAFGTAAKCDASCFRASTWTPSCVECATTVTNFGTSWCGTYGTARVRRLGPFMMICWANRTKGCDICKALAALGALDVQMTAIGCMNSACTIYQFTAFSTSMSVCGYNASGDKCRANVCLTDTAGLYNCMNFAFVNCRCF